MDLNYLFYRQQIERSMAKSARSEPVRKVHEELATSYEERISRATTARKPDTEARPLIHRHVPKSEAVRETTVNPTLAVAITAREVGDGS